MLRPPEITIKHLSKHFAMGVDVLRDLNITIQPGEFVSFLGPSGCGKSTLLRLLAKLESPSEGSITFDNNPQLNELAFLFQESTLLPWLTVAGNISMPLQLRRVPLNERLRISEKLADLVGLKHALDYYPRQLSGGMKMRTSLARALSLNPQLLLLDEPFGALDAISRNRLNEELHAIHHAEKWTAILVTHSIQEAVFLSDRIILLDSQPGRIHEIITVDLPSVRSRALRESKQYQQIVAEINASLSQIPVHI